MKLLSTAYIKSYTRHRLVPEYMTLNDLYARFEVFVADLREIRLLIYCVLSPRQCMTTATKSIKRNKQLPALSVSIEIYSGIVRFPRDSTAFL